MRTPALIPLALALLLTACPKQTTTPDPEPSAEPDPSPTEEVAPTEEPAAEDPALQAQMQMHFGWALTAKAAVINGDLPAASAAYAGLRDTEASNVPDPWMPLMADVKAAAAEGAEAESLVEAAQAVAKVGRACGECHTATEGGPDISTAPPPQEWTAEMDMRRHAWAVDLMWLGLTAPSEEIWKAGAEALSGDSHAEGVELSEEQSPRFAEIEGRVHEAARLAVDSEDADEAATRLAEIMALCATCHAILRE